jgi:hypothetical protein
VVHPTRRAPDRPRRAPPQEPVVGTGSTRLP